MTDVVNHISEFDNKWITEPIINIFCIASLGYMAFDVQLPSWVGNDFSDDFKHIRNFAMGVANTLLAWPQGDVMLGPYLTDIKLGDDVNTTFE